MAPMWIEDLTSIKNELQNLNTTFRTGGNVANAYRFEGSGYNYNLQTDVLGKFFKSPNFGLTYFRQKDWSKNWIDILGEVVEGKDLIYVCNIYQSVDEAQKSIDKFKDKYKCNIVAVELGNENYLNLYRMPITEYLNRCEPFNEHFSKNYKVIYQVSDKNGWKYKEWDDEVNKVAKYKAVHIYPQELIAPSKLINDAIDKYGKDIFITEWNLKQANSKYSIDVWSNWVGEFKKECDNKKIINCYHNHLSPGLGAWSDLNNPRPEILKHFK